MPRCPICGGEHASASCPTAMRVADGSGPLLARERPDPLVGQLVGSYRLTRILGTGGFARVYLGEHPVIGAKVAVKVLRESFADDPELIQRFIGEARATASVIHDNVVQILDISTLNDGRYYIVLEYLEGKTLEELAAGRTLPFEEVAPWMLQLCAALDTAHRVGVVHRDLKPDNVYLVTRGARTVVKLVDFGIARRESLSEGEHRTMQGTILGTPQYIAPEQARGDSVDGRADQYSLGVIMFRLATGRLPFEKPNLGALLQAQLKEPPPSPRVLNPQIDPGYEQLILRTLAKKRDERFASMAELGEAIARLREAPRPATPKPLIAKPSATVRQAPRLSARIPAEVELGDRRLGRERMQITDVSEGGLYLESGLRPPEVFTRVVVYPQLPGAVALESHVAHTSERIDSRTGKPMPGFGVVFPSAAQRTPEQAATLRMLIEVSSAGPRAGRGEIADLLQLLENASGHLVDDHYALLGVPAHADATAIRKACGQLAQVLDPMRTAKLNGAERGMFEKVREAVARAEEVLVDPATRAAYDADRGNFAGVARCLAAGLNPETLKRLRDKQLAEMPELPSLVQPILNRAEQSWARGDTKGLLEALGAALKVDPLNVELQKRYWAARREAQNPPPRHG